MPSIPRPEWENKVTGLPGPGTYSPKDDFFKSGGGALINHPSKNKPEHQVHHLDKEE